MELKQFGFIGLGLIGGSIAKAIRRCMPQAYLIAMDTNMEMVNEALDEGVINEAALEIGAAFRGCDMIFLCAPVSVNNENLEKVAPYVSANTILTDVGSVKTPIFEKARALGLERQFIGGHPMAGSEKTGFSNANPIILENAFYILAPTKEAPQEALSAYQALVKDMGALPLTLDCAEHDYATAAISHVPHLIAAALVNLVHDKDTSDAMMKQLAAGGFKDITRIASSSPSMWEAVSLANADNITALLDSYIASMQDIRDAIAARKAGYVYQLFTDSKEYRDSFIDQPRGPIKKVYGCYVDIPDEPGSIATIATILASKHISIKNVGITHNREFEEGVLQVEFYDQPSLDAAIVVFRKLDYVVYERK